MTGNTFYFDWEVAFQAALQSHLGVLGEWLSRAFTFFGEETILILILATLYWSYDKEFGRFMGLNVIMGVILNPMLKNVVLRRRPYFDHESIRILKPVDSSADIYDIAAQGYSFPSGHSTNSVVAYGTLARFAYTHTPERVKREAGEDGNLYTKGLARLLTVLAVLIPFLVGFSRVALGAHYVTDVLCGWAMGAVILLVLSVLQERIKNRLMLLTGLLVCTLPGIAYCRTEDYFTGLGLLIGFIAAELLEKRFVNFQPAKTVPEGLLRVVGGGILYGVLNWGMKLPFSTDFLDSGTLAAFLVRTGRYALLLFFLMGVYPMCFSVFRKGKKEQLP